MKLENIANTVKEKITAKTFLISTLTPTALYSSAAFYYSTQTDEPSKVLFAGAVALWLTIGYIYKKI